MVCLPQCLPAGLRAAAPQAPPQPALLDPLLQNMQWDRPAPKERGSVGPRLLSGRAPQGKRELLDGGGCPTRSTHVDEVLLEPLAQILDESRFAGEVLQQDKVLDPHAVASRQGALHGCESDPVTADRLQGATRGEVEPGGQRWRGREASLCLGWLSRKGQRTDARARAGRAQGEACPQQGGDRSPRPTGRSPHAPLQPSQRPSAGSLPKF